MSLTALLKWQMISWRSKSRNDGFIRTTFRSISKLKSSVLLQVLYLLNPGTELF